jgi:oligopeptide/dipeptide ABC transporter ATP-binding protein
MSDLLVVRNVVKSFPGPSDMGSTLRRQPRPTVRAVDDVSLDVGRQEILGLVGESGSGKTTLARCLVRLYEPDSGTATFDGQDIFGASPAQLRQIRRRMQLIYQDPYSSLNPQMSVGEAISEPARVHGLVQGGAASRALVDELLDSVGLAGADATRRPRQLSGGQRQRVAIARALAVRPELLIADEAVSALDVSVQAQILNLFADLAEHRQLAMIFVSHQLAVIAQLARRVAIMYRGRIVETGRTAAVFTAPRHPYTSLLLAAHPDVDQPKVRGALAPDRELSVLPSAPGGCRFRDRCELAQPICAEVDPPPVDLGDGHLSWCHVLPTRPAVAATTGLPARGVLPNDRPPVGHATSTAAPGIAG